MAESTATNPDRSSNSSLVWLFVIAAVVAYFLFRAQTPSSAELTGVLLPPLEVAGWFNTERPIDSGELRGKLVVVDCWFVDCPPCRASMPLLAEFNKRFSDQGVQVIGLTPDQDADARRAQEFIESIPGADWPIGYGAHIPLDILGVHSFPTLILFDKSGRAVWAGHDERGLEAATVAALTKSP